MIRLSRRKLLAAGIETTLLAWPAMALGAPPAAASAARMRVISDNDFSGDPDGLVQLAHHLLSPSVAIPLVVGSHLLANSPWNAGTHQATDAANRATDLLRAVQPRTAPRVVAGAERAMASRTGWKPSPATAAIVQEAMRADTTMSLFYAAGASLTELALAWLAEPRIGRQLKLVWIGGNEHPGLAYPPPGPAEPEFNFGLDRIAAQIVFNESDVEIWQVPRDAYRQMLFGVSEMEELSQTGALGRFIKGQFDQLIAYIAKMPAAAAASMGETHVLGDSPLVTLTALQSSFQPDPSSSMYKLLPTPTLADDGSYRDRPAGRPMRVYTSIDAGLTFRDMMAKFRAHARASA